MQCLAERYNKSVKRTNLVVPVHPPPRYCRVPHTRIVQLDDSGYLLPMRLIPNQYPADSTEIDQIEIEIISVLKLLIIIIRLNILSILVVFLYYFSMLILFIDHKYSETQIYKHAVQCFVKYLVSFYIAHLRNICRDGIVHVPKTEDGLMELQ